jgi:glycosyltransferase involved in cell wall biosynthesis
MDKKPRLLRITTVPISLKVLLHGQLTFFKNQGFEVLAVSADGSEVSSLINEGVNHIVVPMSRRITPIGDLICLVQLFMIIRSFRPDIVHTHTPKAGLLGMIAAWLCRIPIRIHTVAGLPLMESRGLKKKLLILTELITYKCASGIYPNALGLKDYIIKNIRINKKIHVIGNGSSNGIDTTYFNRTPTLERLARDIRQKFNIRNNDVVFSFVGRIVRDKGVAELIGAFKSLLAHKSANANFYLIMVGSFEQSLNPLKNEDFQFLNSDKNVILAGFQADVRPWMMASDIFVFPSYREGFPNVVMQAACLELPSIVSDINGSNEIIFQNVSGLIVQPKDELALFEAMLTLALESEKRKNFAANARNYIVKNFEQQFVWKELLKEYKRLLK